MLNLNELDLRYKEEWSYRGNTYTIKLCRWKSGDDNVWNIYVMPFPTHPFYNILKKFYEERPNNYSLPENIPLTFSGGITYFGFEHELYVVGNDYNHLCDDIYRSNTDHKYMLNDVRLLIKEMEQAIAILKVKR